MNLRWDDLKLFLTVYEQKSLSGAARLLKLGQPTLSRRIAELEESVGEILFDRQNHGATPTAAGYKLLPAVQRMAEWANQAESNIQKQTHLPAGKVRIAAPPGIAYEMVAPMAAKIRQQHPQIQIEVLSGVETLNLGRGEADLSLRTEKPGDTDLLCVDEFSSPMRIFTSKEYAARLPSQPELAELDWICWAAPYDKLNSNLQLSASITNFKPAFSSDDFIVQMAACRAGAGAMLLPRAFCQLTGPADLNKLQELDIDLGSDTFGSLYLVCHKRHSHLPKVKLVIDFISEEFRNLRQA